MIKNMKKNICFLSMAIILASMGNGCGKRDISVTNDGSIKSVKINGNETEWIDNTAEEILAFKQNYKKNALNFYADNSAKVSNLGLKYYVSGDIGQSEDIYFQDENNYSDLPGVTAFRGNNMRSGGSYGTAEVKEEKLELIWRKKIGSIDSWTGVGWNGQPAIVQWDKKVVNSMNINMAKRAKENLKEVIYSTLDGNVYFLDLEDGKDTREKLNIGAPIKGSLTVDPRGIPLLYVGQGLNKNGSKFIDFSYRIFSLTDYKKLYEIKGNDSFAQRSWGAFDSTALIEKSTDSLLICGENGIFYSGKLNTKYENGKIEVSPNLVKYKYDVPGKDKKGIENSIAVYKNYGYFADNDGILQCVDINTLKPVWAINVKDDTDSTGVLEKDFGKLSLFTATEVDHQGNNGFSYVRKIDATSGKVLWENKYSCAYYDEVNGGALATPIVGKNDISSLAIFNIARTPDVNGGILVAFNKETGKEVWKLNLNNYCWSSPVVIYSLSGKSYIVQCDSIGKAMLIEGKTGQILDNINLGTNVEGTPAAFNNMIVVGTRGGEIVGFKIK